MSNWQSVGELAVAGLFGSLTRLILDPQEGWKAWGAQMLVGLLCAVYIGGGLAHMLGFDGPMKLACAFVVGTLGEHALKKVQDKFTASKEGGEE